MHFFQKIPSQEKVDFTGSLAMMLKSGVPINEALKSLADQSRSRLLSTVLADVRARVESGSSLSQAMEKHERLFGSVFISMVKSGEVSGSLVENLSFLASWLEREHELTTDIRAATLYPKIVIAAAVIIGGILATVILPKLLPFFEKLHVDLPLSTRTLLAVSRGVQAYGFFIAAGILILIPAAIFLMRVENIRRFIHTRMLRLPIIGSITQTYQLAILFELLSTLIRSGVPIRETLASAGNAAGNLAYRDAFRSIARRVEQGTPFSETLVEFSHLFPKRIITMVATGEKSGTLDIVFSAMAEYYTKEVRSITKRLPMILEPALLVVIALIVGFIALSIITPIYQFTHGIQ